MDLKLFFDKLPDYLQTFTNTENHLGSIIASNMEKMPTWKGVDIAIIGVDEYRGCFKTQKKATNQAANHIREELYQLSRSQVKYNIVDLGNLRLGESKEDTYHRLSEVCEILLRNQVIPFIIGGSHDLTFSQYRSYETLEKFIDVVIVDAMLDMDGNSEEATNSHLHSLLMHQPNYLFSYTHLGHQVYLNDYQYLAILRKLNFDMLSVGEMRQNFQENEPYIRNADMLSFDVKAIKQNTLQAHPNILPFGLTPEEACQLMWYAGLNDKLTSFGLYGYQPETDQSKQMAQVIAVMIWYFLEGFYHRKGDIDIQNSAHTKYIVPIDKTQDNLVFYRSSLSDKWWLELPKNQANETLRVMPCSYQDYLRATKGELPDRWLKALARGV
jgi:formiminoglutamase